MRRLIGVFIATATVAMVAATDARQSKPAAPPAPSTEWPTYGHDPGGMRFSPLTQINPANVNQLQVAWVYHMRPPAPATTAPPTTAASPGATAPATATTAPPPATAPAPTAAANPAAPATPAPTPPPQGRGRGRGRGGSGFAPSGTTPLIINGVMYLTSPYGRVVALDPTTGKEVWTFQVPNGGPSTRGAEYFAGDAKTPPQIVFGTNDGRLFSLHAKTGEPNDAFGVKGIV